MITREKLLERFDVRDDGLYWKTNRMRALVGKRAGSLDDEGYRCITIGANKYKEHRLIYFLAHGDWPPKVDHKNGETGNNSVANLRAATSTQNAQNSKPHKGKRFKGISWDTYNQRWKAQIRANGKNVHLGNFLSPEEAARVYDKAALEHYGHYARLNFSMESV